MLPCTSYLHLANRFRLIAIMIARLEMSVEECITAYNYLMKMVFKERMGILQGTSNSDIKSQFDCEVLGRAFKNIIISRGISNTAKLNDSVQSGCRT